MSRYLKKPINLSMLVLLNIIAVNSIRNWSLMSEIGMSSLFLILLATTVFFIPCIFILSKFSAARSKTGGLFLWIKEAFGNRWGFLAAWCLWLGNLIWIPMILAFIATNLSFLFPHMKAFTPNQTLAFLLLLYWICIGINCKGIKYSTLLSCIGCCVGVLLPTGLLILLGIGFILKGESITITPSAFIPSFNFKTVSLFVTAVFSLMGFELSSAYGNAVDHPKRVFPRALLSSSLIVFLTMIFGTLAFIVVLPAGGAVAAQGIISSLSYFFAEFQLPYLSYGAIILLTLGAFATLNTWTLAPSRILWAAALHKELPEIVTRINPAGAPTFILQLQGILVSLLCIFFMWAPSLKPLFWILFGLSSQLYLVVYLLLFASAIRLRKIYSEHSAPFEKKFTPFKTCFFSILGLITTSFCFLSNFIPSLHVDNVFLYVAFLPLTLCVVCIFPFMKFTGKKSSQKKEMLSSY